MRPWAGWPSDFEEGRRLVKSGLIPDLGGEEDSTAECGIEIHNTPPKERLTPNQPGIGIGPAPHPPALRDCEAIVYVW